MNPLALSLFDLISASPEKQTYERTQLRLMAVVALLASVVLAALWGLAAGSGQHLSVGNALHVPTLVVVSGAASLPITMLAGKLLGGERVRTTTLLVSYAAAVFTGTLVLALLAPIVALYQHSSVSAGPYVAYASAILAFVTGTTIFLRVARKIGGTGARPLAASMLLLAVTQIATLSQLASVMPPVFGERTTFGHGIDGLSSAPTAPTTVTP